MRSYLKGEGQRPSLGGSGTIKIAIKKEEFGTVIPKAKMERRFREAYEKLGYEVEGIEGYDVGTYVSARKPGWKLFGLFYHIFSLDNERGGYYIPSKSELRQAQAKVKTR